MTHFNGEIYEGEWVNDKRNGKGNQTLPNGEVYEGEFKDDKRHGKGKCQQADGDLYEGQYANNKKHGKGLCTITSQGKEGLRRIQRNEEWDNGNLIEESIQYKEKKKCCTM